MSLVRVLALCSLVFAWPLAAAQQASPRFPIHEFEIEGNTVLPVGAVEAAVLPFMGDEREIGDVEKAREALERVYQQAGYLSVFVDVPEQRVDAGLVTLRVTEGRVDRLRITGSRYYDQGMIRERVAALAPGNVPDFNEVQRQIGALTRDERQLQPVLRPGLLPGTVEAELKVTDKPPMGGSVEINNRHAANTDAWRLSASARYDNLFQRDHSISITGITAPRETQNSKVALLNYTAPIGDGQTLLGYLVWSDSFVEPLGASVTGNGVTIGARWLKAFYIGDSSHSLGTGFDLKDLDQSTDIGDENAVTNPLKYMPFLVSYNAAGPLLGGVAQLDTSFTFAMRGILKRTIGCTSGDSSNVGKVDQFQCSRDGADGSFAYWRGDLRHTTALPAGLPGTLALRLGWQLASERLVSGEQYAIGGAETVRGYLEAEGSGDHALLGSVEWRSPSFAMLFAPEGATAPGFVEEATVLAFVDAARAYTIAPTAGVAARVPLLGTGIGLRVRAARSLSAEVDLAWPHKATPDTPDDDPRWHLRVLAQF